MHWMPELKRCRLREACGWYAWYASEPSWFLGADSELWQPVSLHLKHPKPSIGIPNISYYDKGYIPNYTKYRKQYHRYTKTFQTLRITMQISTYSLNPGRHMELLPKQPRVQPQSVVLRCFKTNVYVESILHHQNVLVLNHKNLAAAGGPRNPIWESWPFNSWTMVSLMCPEGA